MNTGALSSRIYSTFVIQLIYTILNWAVFKFVEPVNKKLNTETFGTVGQVLGWALVIIVLAWLVLTVLGTGMPFTGVCLVVVTIALSWYTSMKYLGDQPKFVLISFGIAAAILLVAYFAAVSTGTDLTTVVPFNLLAGPWSLVISLLLMLVFLNTDEKYQHTFAIIGIIFLSVTIFLVIQGAVRGMGMELDFVSMEIYVMYIMLWISLTLVVKI